MSFIKNLQMRVNKVTEGYFANWTPDYPISVGDYGDVNGYRFTKDGNISRYTGKIEIDERRSKTATFEKNDGVIAKAGISGQASIAGLENVSLHFASEGAFLYHLKDLTNIQFTERRVAFETLGKLILSGKIQWKDNYVLVTEIKQAGKAFILVADSANAEMQLAYRADQSEAFNLANAVGDIKYTRDSDRIIRYEIKEKASVLFRVAKFSEAPTDGGGQGSFASMMKKMRNWFGYNLPLPETIYMSDYVQREDSIEASFMLPGSRTIKVRQEHENIDGFIGNSESHEPVGEDITIETVHLGKRRMRG